MMTVILTGGASRRMGSDKARLPFDGALLVERLVDRYSAIGTVSLSVAATGSFHIENAIELPDRYPGQGPLNGIVSAFENTVEDRIFLTAVDLPNGDAELASVIMSSMGDADACVIRRADGKPEPVFAVYSRSCLDSTIRCLEEGKRSFMSLFDKINIRYLPEKELTKWDLDWILFNMNTPEDYKKLLQKGEK